MRDKTVPEMDRDTDKLVALFALLALAGAVLGRMWPLAGAALLVALALGVVIVMNRPDRPQDQDEHTDSDMHLADVAHQDEGIAS